MPEENINQLDQLLKALSAADQNLEGAFRVRTWKMVIQEIIKLRDTLKETGDIIKNTPSVEEIKQTVENNIQKNLANEDESKVIF